MSAADWKERKVTILLAGVRSHLSAEARSLLENQPDFRVIGEPEEESTAVYLVESLKPDVLIVNRILNRPDASGVIKRTREKSSNTKILVFSEHYDEKEAIQDLPGEVAGYISKESQSTELVRAIREVNQGRRYLNSSLLDKVITTYLQKVQMRIKDSYDLLTVREKEVLHLIACGYSTLNIAGKLHISRNTVESHRTRILRKLSSRS
jgi:DNA-binding NarL/FixJ family response regulator